MFENPMGKWCQRVSKKLGLPFLVFGLLLGLQIPTIVRADPSSCGATKYNINTTPEETNIWVKPGDSTVLLFGTVIGSHFYYSTNGGSSWTACNDSIKGYSKSDSSLQFNGDPSVAIDTSGRFYIAYTKSGGYQLMAYSDDNGLSWTRKADPGDAGGDRNNLWVDGRNSSPYCYVARTVSAGKIRAARSTDRGVSWSSGAVISDSVKAIKDNRGVRVVAGPSTHVYCAWAVYDSSNGSGEILHENAIGFARSKDRGATWEKSKRIKDGIYGMRHTTMRNGVSFLSSPKYGISWPSITVNQRNGKYLWVVWANWGRPPGCGSSPYNNTSEGTHIFVMSSSDSGATWSNPRIVSQDTTTDQWQPWIDCDPLTGWLTCIYNSSNTGNSNTKTIVAKSIDGGYTWSECSADGTSWAVSAVSHFDAQCVDMMNGRIFPAWRRQDSGLYVAPFSIRPSGCCSGSTGNIDDDAYVDISDLALLISYVSTGGNEPYCIGEANVDGQAGVTQSDADYLTDYLYDDGPAPVSCP